MENREVKFDNLMTEYRAACPEPDGSASFLPNLWRQIEAQKTFLRHVRGWTSAYVTAAALICLLLVVLIALQASRPPGLTYIDVLNEDQDTSELVKASGAPR